MSALRQAMEQASADAFGNHALLVGPRAAFHLGAAWMAGEGIRAEIARLENDGEWLQAEALKKVARSLEGALKP